MPLLLCLPLSGVLAASSGEALLFLGPAPVTTVLKCRVERPYGVGRPQQASGYVCKCFSLHTNTHKHTHTHKSFFVKLGRDVLEVTVAVCVCVYACVRACECVLRVVYVINPLSKDSLSC